MMECEELSYLCARKSVRRSYGEVKFSLVDIRDGEVVASWVEREEGAVLREDCYSEEQNESISEHLDKERRMSSTRLSELPEEMLRRILCLLPPNDLKTAMLVCKLWKSIVNDPKLWTWAVVSVNTRLDLERLKLHRLQLIQCIRLPSHDHPNCVWSQPDNMRKLLKEVLDIPCINLIHGIETYDLGSVEPCLLSRLLGKLNVLKLNNHQLKIRNLSTMQLHQIFTAISERSSAMKELVVVGIWATNLSPTLFASAVSNVRKLELSVCGEDQMLALLQEIIENERPLAKLHLSSCEMDSIRPDLVGKAFNKLEEVVVSNCRYGWVSHEQLTATLRGVLDEKGKLKKLLLDDILSYGDGIDIGLLMQAAKKIGKFWSVRN